MNKVLRTAFVMSWAALACTVGHAQPTFDAVSVKAAPPPDGRGGRRVAMAGGPGTPTPGRINFENVGLGALISKAYDVKYYQVSGPDWLTGPDAPRFNIIASVPPGTTVEQFRLMLQKLLADRFKLKLHKETKELAIYSLGIAKNGPKLKKAAPDPPPDANDATDGPPSAGGGKIAKDAEGYPVLRPGMTMAMAGDRARIANQEYMQWLVDMLAGQTGRPVVDATGLTGKYDFALYWIPRPPDTPPLEDPAGPDLFAALQQQMGLKLEPKKGPVEVLVVEHAEKIPIAN
jgi:uncharacterized protein (TIGR03435 family)